NLDNRSPGCKGMAPQCCLRALRIRDGIRTKKLEKSRSVPHWWTSLASLPGCDKKGLMSLIVLVNWSIGLERNARIFDNKHSNCPQVLAKIRDEVALWVCAGSRHLANFVASL
ncbi:hypothetical protein U9M48_021817, partial [Paspalum notatum var. saurae]